MHLHDERLVLLLPLAGVLVVLERERERRGFSFNAFTCEPGTSYLDANTFSDYFSGSRSA